MLELPDELKEDLTLAKALMSPLTVSEKIESITKLKKNIDFDNSSILNRKEKLINEIKDKNIIEEIKKTKERKISLLEKLKIIFGL